MAKLEQTLYEDFDHLLNRIEDGIKAGSSSATLEEFSDFAAGSRAACASLSDTATWEATA